VIFGRTLDNMLTLKTELAVAIDSYASHLEPSFCKVPLPPLGPNAIIPPTFDLSHTYFSSLDDEFSRVYEEYERRLNSVRTLCSEIITLWAELGTPQAQTESNIVEHSRESPEQLGLHKDDLGRLQAKRDRLVDEKQAREKRIQQMSAQIEQLWERLCIPEEECRVFKARNRGVGMRIINEYEDELARLLELKKQNLGLFVEESRIQIQALWDSLYFSEEEMLDFTPAFSGASSSFGRWNPADRFRCLQRRTSCCPRG
jgi:protein regulator of cytokinesis 1